MILDFIVGGIVIFLIMYLTYLLGKALDNHFEVPIFRRTIIEHFLSGVLGLFCLLLVFGCILFIGLIGHCILQ